MTDIAKIREEIKYLKEYMRMKELSDDFYYTRGSYPEDNRRLYDLNKKLQLLLDNNDEYIVRPIFDEEDYLNLSKEEYLAKYPNVANEDYEMFEKQFQEM